MSAAVKSLPVRSKVKTADTWDLTGLFKDDAAWEKAFRDWEAMVPRFAAFAGTLGKSAKNLAEALKFDTQVDRAGEKIGAYAFLKVTEDAGSSEAQGRKARYFGVASRAAQAASFIRPEILAIPNATMKKFLADPALADYRWTLQQLLRYKPHTLSPGEEKLLAMQIEMAQVSDQAFHQLNDVDLKFGVIKPSKGDAFELSHASYSKCLNSPDRKLRAKAFHQYYQEYADHANTLAATLSGSIQRDIYYARARNYDSALGAALYDDDVPVSVYDNLIAAVRSHLPTVHRYYELRRRAMKLPDIHQYDTYAPILSQLDVTHTWTQAVRVVIASLAPLGPDYTKMLEAGLSGRWCDRYENKGKQSGAFSYGIYDCHPFILMNYQPDVLNHVFTLTHEAGHAMHSYYSAKSQPFQYYNYRIFVAEVASTFNEQLLSHHLLRKAKTDKERAYYLNREIDDIRGTIVRQTMFAEFEKITHALAEANEPLTLDRFRSEYQKLLEAYFGPKFVLDPELSLECLRIPHFYRAFYVYKYATGMSAAIALSRRVLGGGKEELGAYLNFLKGGGSKYPLDLLRDAGVDMAKPEPVEVAMDHFARLVDELEELL